MWAEDYELYSGTITEGDYVIVYNDVAMKNTVTSDRFDNLSVTISEDKISNPAATIVWHIAASGDYWTIYNANVSKYAASTGAKNKGQLLASGTDDRSLWTVSGTSTYEFVNKKNDANGVNKNLRRNGDNGWACYSTSTGGALSLYKKVEATGDATTVTINSTGITNTNKFFGTAAGTLTASVVVTSTSAAVDGATVTWSSSDEDVATIGETTGVVTLVGEGTTTITASYAGVVDEYKSSYDEYELTVTNENPNAVTLWSEDFSDYSADDVPKDGTYGYTCYDATTSVTKIYDANMAGGTSPELLVSKSGGYFQAVVPLENIKGDLKLKFKKYNNALSVSTSTDGITISGTSSFSDAGEFTVTFTGVTTSMTSVTIKFTATGGSNVRIDDIVLKGSKVEPVTIGSSKYASFCSGYALDFTDTDVKAYKAKVDEGKVVLTQVDKVPANTGVILYCATADDYDVPVIASASAVSENELIGVTARTLVEWTTGGDGKYNYILQAGQFKKAATGGYLKANRAYLHTSYDVTSPGAHELEMVFDGEQGSETTGIAEINTKKEFNGEFFNLNGQKVQNPTKGLYIVNGRKVVIK